MGSSCTKWKTTGMWSNMLEGEGYWWKDKTQVGYCDTLLIKHWLSCAEYCLLQWKKVCRACWCAGSLKPAWAVELRNQRELFESSLPVQQASNNVKVPYYHCAFLWDGLKCFFYEQGLIFIGGINLTKGAGGSSACMHSNHDGSTVWIGLNAQKGHSFLKRDDNTLSLLECKAWEVSVWNSPPQVSSISSVCLGNNGKVSNRVK